MSTPLTGKDYVSLTEYSPSEFQYLLDLAIDLKAKQKKGTPHALLQGKTLAMIFQKASTRTRVSFEVAMYHLGGLGLFLSANDLQIGRGEPIQDTARVLASYSEGILIRTYSHQEVETLARYSKAPVINGLTDDEHPTQALADLLTVYEEFGSLKGRKLAFIGDGNNVAVSLMHACALAGMEIVLASPKNYRPGDKAIGEYEKMKQPGSSLAIVEDPREAVSGADVLYTDVWASMGQEKESQARLEALKGYQVDQALLKLAKPEAIVMHCLPAHRGEEITDEVMEGSQSRIFQEAENRMHAHKAILAALL
ncbi:MAG: ornithine carbamoyltransferase [Peptococcaceae bacterium]|jgi:ornithine carbamoyltransferase|nr:ornithine carbamoyltransferase [Peptococcaceae bacterium]